MRQVVQVFLSLAVTLALAEFSELAPWLAERLLQWAARGLPKEHHQPYVEDWLGELDAVPGKLTKLAFAVRVVVRVPATHRALLGRDPIWVEAARGLLSVLITAVLMVLRLLNQLRGQLPSRNVLVVLDEALRYPKHLRPNTPIISTGLSWRTIHTLERTGINTFADLRSLYASRGESGFFRIRNLGRREMNDIMRVLERGGVLRDLDDGPLRSDGA
jgi:RNA polymerase alpha subunit